MGLNSFLKSPKKEEQQVPDSNIVSHFNGIKNVADKEVDIMDDLERILGISEDEEKLTKTNINVGQLNWEFTDIWDEFRNGEEYQEEEEEEEDERDMKLFDKEITKCFFEEEGYYNSNNGIINVKKEHVGFWDDDYRRVSLNLNLNYQEVLDAWSNRGSLRADDYSLSMATNGCNYMGEVPVMEEEKTRREASVLRYKEKRQTRLFSKKIRYQVRKLNADKRPRLKGRFVKRVS
ncbi:zinc finger protein CONSTANS-LIKE 6 [Morus notabilis]|uniref:zinc finger protein CONSTANS-LIKE 6 n=1 Tax=Morus notabilis TaxID=981085 RepID=UPI000CED48EB|nr:zinc finger protein CONSTANS-LIKE 6 [Morus notabilis]